LTQRGSEERSVTRDELLNDREVGEVLDLQPSTIRKKRCEGSLPIRYIKVGRKVFYKRADVLRYLEAHVFEPASVEAVSERRQGPH
jgi:hypothetical protein